MIKEIEVTEEDIKNGIKECSDSCPIALALNRAFDNQGVQSVEVDSWDIRVELDDSSFLNMSCDEQQRSFIAHFDAGLPVQPFKFVMNADFEYPEQDDCCYDSEGDLE